MVHHSCKPRRHFHTHHFTFNGCGLKNILILPSLPIIRTPCSWQWLLLIFMRKNNYCTVTTMMMMMMMAPMVRSKTLAGGIALVCNGHFSRPWRRACQDVLSHTTLALCSLCRESRSKMLTGADTFEMELQRQNSGLRKG